MHVHTTEQTMSSPTQLFHRTLSSYVADLVLFLNSPIKDSRVELAEVIMSFSCEDISAPTPGIRVYTSNCKLLLLSSAGKPGRREKYSL